MPGVRLLAGVLVLATAAGAQDRIAPNSAMSVPDGRFVPATRTPATRTPAARPEPSPAPAFEPPGFVRPAASLPIQTASFEEPAPPAETPTRTPINRGPAPETTDDGRPSAAATLRKGIWTSGTAVRVLAVVGGFLVLKLRRGNPALVGGLPAEAVEVLGRRRVDGRNAVTLVRVGGRMLVVGIGEDGMRTLCEVDDPVEVDRLAGLCRPPESDSRFATALRQAIPRTSVPQAAPAQTAPRPQPAAPPATPPRQRTARPSGEMADLPGRRERPRLDVTTP